MTAAVRAGLWKVKDLIQKHIFKVKRCLHVGTSTDTDDIRRFPILVLACATPLHDLQPFIISSLFNAEATRPRDDGVHGIV